MTTIARNDLMYLAGFMDGEGCFKIDKYGRTVVGAAGSRIALKVCRELLPYLKEKQEQANLLVSFQETKVMGRRPIPAEIFCHREDLLLRCKMLNGRCSK